MKYILIVKSKAHKYAFIDHLYIFALTHNISMFISSCSSLYTGKRVVPLPTEEIGVDHSLGFEVNQRLARRGSSRQYHHIWAGQTLLPRLSAGTLLSE